MKYLAVLHDGTFGGDNSFGVSTEVGGNMVDFKKGETLAQLKVKFKVNLAEDYGEDDETIEYMLKDVKGAWILDKQALDHLNNIMDIGDLGGDSACYLANHIFKKVVAALACQTLGKKPKNSEYDG